MALQSFGKGTLRVAKNYTKGYSDVQGKARAATSNDPLPPTGQALNELSQLSYNQNDFIEIIEILDKRLNDKGKNWRHVYKSLAVIDYLLHSGSENVVLYFKSNIYIIKTLCEFQYIEEDTGKDQGANVRLKAKDISNLLRDETRLRETRRNRATMRDRMMGRVPGEADDNDDAERNENNERRNRQNALHSLNKDREDAALQRAIKESARAELVKQGRLKEEADVEKALKLSAEDEENRKRALAASSGGSLFDDDAPVANNAGGNELISLGDMPTYNQFMQPPQTLVPQFTAFNPSFNPYQQQAELEAQQAEYLRQRAEQEWMQQQMMAQQQAAQQQAQAQAQQQYEQQQWFLQQQQQQQQMFPPAQQLIPQPTGFGSNNPFARNPSPAPPLPFNTTNSGFSTSSSSSMLQSPTSPSSPSLQTPTSPSGPGYSSFKVAVSNKPEHEQLASLFANREDGMDTFGNYGQLRYGPNQASQQLAMGRS